MASLTIQIVFWKYEAWIFEEKRSERASAEKWYCVARVWSSVNHQSFIIPRCSYEEECENWKVGEADFGFYHADIAECLSIELLIISGGKLWRYQSCFAKSRTISIIIIVFVVQPVIISMEMQRGPKLSYSVRVLLRLFYYHHHHHYHHQIIMFLLISMIPTSPTVVMKRRTLGEHVVWVGHIISQPTNSQCGS